MAPLRPEMGNLEPGLGHLKSKISLCMTGKDTPKLVNSLFSSNVDSEGLWYFIEVRTENWLRDRRGGTSPPPPLAAPPIVNLIQAYNSPRSLIEINLYQNQYLKC